MSSPNETKYDRLTGKQIRRAGGGILEIEMAPFLLLTQFFVFLGVEPPEEILEVSPSREGALQRVRA